MINRIDKIYKLRKILLCVDKIYYYFIIDD